MVNPIPESVRKIWEEWNIRGVILLSLSLQVILTLFAPLRKGARNKLVIMLLWSVYLLADVAAVFALGLISNTKGDIPGKDTSLFAFWPPFLILHLGGPDNITAFALEDNELWLRHFVGFLVQAVAAVYIFLLSLPKTKLAAPTILMFIAASIRYLERTRAFYLSSFDGFQNSISKEPNPGYIMDKEKIRRILEEKRQILEQRREIQENIRVARYVHKAALRFIGPEEITKEFVEVVSDAYRYLRIFKGIIVNLIFSFHQHEESQRYFRRLSPETAYGIIEVELNFIYEILYTKVQVLFSLAGCIGRFISFGLVVAAFAIFHFKAKKNDFDEFDVAITYTLFLGAIALDIIALFILISFDLTLGALADWNRKPKFLCKMLDWILNLKKPKWDACDNHFDECKQKVLATPFLFGRWSGYVSRYNLLSYCLKKRLTRVQKTRNCLHRCIEKIIHSLGVVYLIQKLAMVFKKVSQHKLLHFLGSIKDSVTGCLGLADFLDGIRFVSHEPLTKEVWESIVNELREKSWSATNPKAAIKISSARGESILEERDCSSLLPYVSQVTYDKSILVWHIATELLYLSEHEVSRDNYIDCEVSKFLSDYMLYLLIIHPTVMPVVIGIANMRFQDTCAQTIKFLKSKNLKTKDEIKEIREEILVELEGTVLPGESKSVLLDAVRLAKELKKLDDLEEGKKEDKWKLMRKIWVEMLSYAATSSGSSVHAQQVNRGGELITFVWLLMAHFGLQRQFQDITQEDEI